MPWLSSLLSVLPSFFCSFLLSFVLSFVLFFSSIFFLFSFFSSYSILLVPYLLLLLKVLSCQGTEIVRNVHFHCCHIVVGCHSLRPCSMQSFLVPACILGTFGPECIYTCSNCQNGAMCNEEKDACMCTAGWQGILCDKPCDEVSPAARMMRMR